MAEGELQRDPAVMLDTFVPADAAVLLDADRDPEHRRRFDFPRDFVATLSHCERVIAGWQRQRRAGERFAYAVRNIGTRELLGGVELRPLGDGTANLSYWTHPRHRGRGIASSAVALVCDLAFDEFGFRAVRVVIDPDNVASIRVAVRNRFSEVGLIEGRMNYVRSA